MDSQVKTFLAQYDEQVFENALKVRELVLATLPDIIEQLDVKAKMVAYCYGQKYAELICVLIPSKKRLKLGFNRGTQLVDPEGMLEGNAKISRYVEIKEPINKPALKGLLRDALRLYKEVI